MEKKRSSIDIWEYFSKNDDGTAKCLVGNRCHY